MQQAYLALFDEQVSKNGKKSKEEVKKDGGASSGMLLGKRSKTEDPTPEEGEGKKVEPEDEEDK